MNISITLLPVLLITQTSLYFVAIQLSWIHCCQFPFTCLMIIFRKCFFAAVFRCNGFLLSVRCIYLCLVSASVVAIQLQQSKNCCFISNLLQSHIKTRVISVLLKHRGVKLLFNFIGPSQYLKVLLETCNLSFTYIWPGMVNNQA